MYFRNKNPNAPSQMFLDAQQHRGGNISVDCSCGITHIAIDSKYYTEYYDNEKIHEQEEGTQLHTGCDGVGYTLFNGLSFVDECDSCQKRLRQYEEFIWLERDNIRHYLNIRIAQEKRWVDQEIILNKLME
jgi:hypothetical protein